MPVDRIMSLRFQTEIRNTNFLRSIFEQVNSTTKRRKRRRLKFWREARTGLLLDFVNSYPQCWKMSPWNAEGEYPEVRIWNHFLEGNAFWILSFQLKISFPVHNKSCLKDLGKLFELHSFQSSESSYLKTRFHICENYDLIDKICRGQYQRYRANCYYLAWWPTKWAWCWHCLCWKTTYQLGLWYEILDTYPWDAI